MRGGEGQKRGCERRTALGLRRREAEQSNSLLTPRPMPRGSFRAQAKVPPAFQKPTGAMPVKLTLSARYSIQSNSRLRDSRSTCTNSQQTLFTLPISRVGFHGTGLDFGG